jgi:hypothetical protein
VLPSLSTQPLPRSLDRLTTLDEGVRVLVDEDGAVSIHDGMDISLDTVDFFDWIVEESEIPSPPWWTIF